MSFTAANAAYETWLKGQCDVFLEDLEFKHEKMSSSPFVFLRATCFRWSEKIGSVLENLAQAPEVLSVGDCHLENFGTWRDQESRLVWGVNDFDEAAVTPYPFDLVRLMTSIRLARNFKWKLSEAADAIATGYREGLDHPRSTLLYEADSWMLDYATTSKKQRAHFWRHIDGLQPEQPGAIPQTVRDLLVRSLPHDHEIVKFCRRPRQGCGSLGRPRYLAVANWRSGRLIREAKALVAASWDVTHKRTSPSRLLELARGPFRAFDPFLATNASESYVVRRIWADSRKLELGARPGEHLHVKLLHAMGREIGAIHAAGSDALAAIKTDLDTRDDGWLHDAAKKAQTFVEADFEEWCQSQA